MAVLGLALAGCATTQTTAARLQLNDTRLRDVAESVRVPAERTSSVVSVIAHSLLSRDGRYTAVVTLENHGDRAVSDLPVSVGYRLGAHTVYINGAKSLPSYFDNHIPAIAAHHSLTWVVSGRAEALPARARAFVRVGVRPGTDLGRFTIPRIEVAPATARMRGSGRHVLTVHLRNGSSIPQYQLPVYAVVSQDGHVVAAQSHSVADLPGGAEAVIRIPLPETGRPSTTRSIQVEAPATIFR